MFGTAGLVDCQFRKTTGSMWRSSATSANCIFAKSQTTRIGKIIASTKISFKHFIQSEKVKSVSSIWPDSVRENSRMNRQEAFTIQMKSLPLNGSRRYFRSTLQIQLYFHPTMHNWDY